MGARHYVDGVRVDAVPATGITTVGGSIYYNANVTNAQTALNLTPSGDLSMNEKNIIFTTGGILYGDIGFTESECDICKKEFVVGEQVCLVVSKVEKGKKTLMRPVHLKCSFKKAFKKNEK